MIVALSARSLAQAATRAGYAATALDLFGDLDTRQAAAHTAVVPGDVETGFDAEALIETVERLAPAGKESGLVYGSGLESRPTLLERLARGRRLWGNPPEVLGAVKNPAAFFGLLDRLGLPHPEVRTELPAETEGWLVKTIGASGGSHVQALATGAVPAAESYYQRRVPGRPVSCLFLANGSDAAALGWSEQWPSPDLDHPFRFGGAVQPATLPAPVTCPIEAALPTLVKETGLLGLNSLDLMADGDGGFHVLEVNPRPGASLDVFDGDGAGALFGRHIAACEGRLLPGWQKPKRPTAMAVVYADRLLVVPGDVSYPAWLADRPAPGSRIEAGAPVCTVMAEAGDAEAARRLVRARSRWFFDALAAEELG